MNDLHLTRMDIQWGHGTRMMDWGYGMGSFGILLNIVIWVAIIIGIISLIRWLVTSSKFNEHKTKFEDSAIEVLRKRYAMGEISKEEFEEKRKDLMD